MGLRASIKDENNLSHRQRVGDGIDRADTSGVSSSSDRRHDLPSASSPAVDDTRTAVAPTTAERSPAPQPQESGAWTARGKLLLSFYDVISHAINSPEMARKCVEIADRDGSMSDTPLAAAANPSSPSLFGGEYSAEAALIVANKQKRDAELQAKTFVAGFLTFAALRVAPTMRRSVASWVRNASAARSGDGGIYRFDRLPAGTKKIVRVAESEASSTGSGGAQKSKLRQMLRFTFDATVSTAAAFLSGTFLFTPRPTVYIEDMSKLPLVEGKSLYAEMVCPPLMGEYRRVLGEYGGRWPVKVPPKSDVDESANVDKNGQTLTWTQEDESLNVIRAFVTHCSMRSKYEKALMEDRAALNQANRELSTQPSMATKWVEGVTGKKVGNDGEKRRVRSMKLGTVVVPSPGVPNDIVIDIDRDVRMLTEEVSDE